MRDVHPECGVREGRGREEGTVARAAHRSWAPAGTGHQGSALPPPAQPPC